MKKTFAKPLFVTVLLIALLVLPTLLTACARRPISPATPSQGTTEPTTLPSQSVPETTTLPLLSQMTEEECIAFIKANNVPIPEGLDQGENFGAYIKRIITAAEKDPNSFYGGSSAPGLNEMANSIVALVNEYYGRNTETTGSGK